MKYQVLRACNITGEMSQAGDMVEASEKAAAPLVKAGVLKATGKAPAKKAPAKKAAKKAVKKARK